jgi:hypothetical protein
MLRKNPVSRRQQQQQRPKKSRTDMHARLHENNSNNTLACAYLLTTPN